MQHPSRLPCAAWGSIPRIGREKVKGIGSANWRIVGSVEAMVEKAKAIDQDWIWGIGHAQWLAKAR